MGGGGLDFIQVKTRIVARNCSCLLRVQTNMASSLATQKKKKKLQNFLFRFLLNILDVRLN